LRFPLAAFAIVACGWIGTAQSLFVVPVTAHPFSGDEVTVEKYASNVRGASARNGTVRVFRDSAGRTRSAMPIPDSTYDAPPVVIHDPISGVDYRLDEKNKIAYRLTFPEPRAEVRSSPVAMYYSGIPVGAPITPPPVIALPFSASGKATPPVPITSLGEGIIEGFGATGSRRGGTDSPTAECEFPYIYELWYSSELEMPLVESWSSCLASRVSRLVNIVRAEPDPSLFGPPRDYKIVEREWSHGISASGPPVPPMPAFEFPHLPPPPTK
jgi:hypothetical protein